MKQIIAISNIKRTIMPAMAVLYAALLTVCCQEQTHGDLSETHRTQIDSITNANRQNIDSLITYLGKYNSEDDIYGKMTICRELGKCYRNRSRFTDAIAVHKLGLTCAETLKDTLQIIQALNNIGTNLRRMGILDEATSYHYRAMSICESYSDQTSRTARKNKVVSINGAANIHLTLGNFITADSLFRLALKGETELGSEVGKAINYANIGSIFEQKNSLDSAKIYYTMSMEANENARSNTGIALCHTHLGRIFEMSDKPDSAIIEYSKAIDLMDREQDLWHWLEPCIALSRVYIQTGRANMAEKYLSKAEKTAEAIGSTEHKAEIQRLNYLRHKNNHDYKKALDSYIRSSALSDSVSNEATLRNMQEIRVRYEREKKENEIASIRTNYLYEKNLRTTILTTSAVIILLFVLVILFLRHIIRLRIRSQSILKEMDKMRTTFFTNVTHEFRTPLTIIQSAAEDIISNTKEEDTRKESADILRHGHRLLDLVNQILDIAKMTSGKDMLSPKWAHGDIVLFTNLICENYRGYATDKGLRLICSHTQQSVEMDFVPDYMQKIIQNILSNAIKFSPSGKDILVNTSVYDDTLTLTITDFGIGMTAEQKAMVFQPFYQASGESRLIGTGIGLSLVKLCTDAMEGSISLDSQPGKGTKFTVRLPMVHYGKNASLFNIEDYFKGSHQETKPEALAGTNAKTHTSDNNEGDIVMGNNIGDITPCNGGDNDIRVLIVEDTLELAHYMMKQLGGNYNIIYAENGEEGLKKAIDTIPDLIITDIMMPIMDGYELCRRVRQSELLSHVPIIMITAKASHEDKLTGLEAGADAYMEKPFRSDELRIRVEKLLEQRAILRKKYSLSDRPKAEVQNTSSTETSSGNGVPNIVISEKDRQFISKFKSYVEEMMQDGKLDYDSIADKMHITRTQLNRKVKAVTGMTTTEMILEIRIATAKNLLENSDLTVSEIAVKCGMENLPYFSTVFKKAVGMTPSQYKSMSLKQQSKSQD